MRKLRTKLMSSGDIRMFDQLKPTLPAGRYELEATHEIIYQKSGPQTISAEAKQVFYVKGTRFVLDAADELVMHPPMNSKGKFGHILPHLTIAKPGLLWERQLKLMNGDQLPWLSLLMLGDDEWPGDGTPQTGTVGQFLDSADKTVFIPVLEDIQEEELQSQCRYIEIEAGKFKQFMPPANDQKYFAGARKDGIDQGISVISCHRFPQADLSKIKGKQFAVYLVSLEGLEPCLEGDWDGIQRVRMICLHYWKFTTFPDNGESFRELLERLIESTTGEKEDNWLRYPKTILDDDEDGYLCRQLADGFAPLVYHAISGEETIAWYRGPFVPVKNIPVALENKSFTSSEAMIYDSEQGIFDLSWPVAWNIGRLLALSDGAVAIHLMKWRKRLTEWLSRNYLAPSGVKAASRFEDGFKSPWAFSAQSALNYQSDSVVAGVRRRSWRREKRSARRHPIEELEGIIRGQRNDSLLSRDTPDESYEVKAWAERTSNKVDIPLSYMVSLEKMLPMERMRVFLTDPNWMRFLINGALTIGVQTELDDFVNRWILNAAVPKINHTFGLLLRSALVSGWPALQIGGYDHGGDAGAYEPVRIQEQVLLALFQRIPDTITITEPHEELSYGMNDDCTITLRHVALSTAGDIVMRGGPTGNTAATVNIRDCIDDHGVVETPKLIDKFVAEIPDAPGAAGWKPVHHTLQLMNGADEGLFDLAP